MEGTFDNIMMGDKVVFTKIDKVGRTIEAFGRVVCNFGTHLMLNCGTVTLRNFVEHVPARMAH